MQKLGSKFFVFIGTLILFFSVFLLYRTWTTSKSHVERLAGQEADLALSFDIAVRDYVREKIQPRMFELADRKNFDPETMSPTYIARSIFEKIQKNFPDIIVKFSAANPKNPANLAGPEELRLIDFFNKNPAITDWSGEIAINNKRYTAKFHARQMEESCLLCHGNPDDAPGSIIKLYGPSSGFNWPLGKVVGLDTIAIPIDWIHDHLWSDLSKNFMIISIGVASLFMAIFFVFKFLVTARLNRRLKKPATILQWRLLKGRKS